MSRTYKLVSAHETLLGTVTVPAYWGDILDSYRGGYGEVRFHVHRETPMHEWFGLGPQGENAVTFREAALTKLGWSRFGPDTVRLRGVTPEEFEELPGCTFSPGAGYLRSLIG